MAGGRRPGAAIFAFPLALAGCDSPVEATGERWVYSNDDVDVALVQVYEQHAPDAARLRHAVMCRSEATASRWRRARGEVWPGWTRVGDLPDVEKASPLARAQQAALDAASGAARDRLLAGEDWLAWQAGSHIDFTFDDCLTWARFDLVESLPSSDLDSSRAAHGAADTGIKIANLEVTPPRVRFTVYSPWLTHTGKRDVETRDGGRTWQVVR